ncbi:hypothetical protein L2E82_39697 [Cichorium intybus]|uniref:Uncharacterized protein n=1 Tax=Cichorium intybus TaxID=13427 RepID=A0ACB9AJP8_CICIN|nr:hypothetical protein L2E82_39697 [Cichorium intybus]
MENEGLYSGDSQWRTQSSKEDKRDERMYSLNVKRMGLDGCGSINYPSLANSTANKQSSKCCFYCNHQICTDILVHADGLLAICTLVAPLGTQVRRHQTTLF